MQPVINKKLHFHYQILDLLEAGIVLTGGEVKAVKSRQVNIGSAFVSFSPNNELFVINLAIQPYKYSHTEETYQPDRPKKLLLKKKEIFFLKGKLQQKGLTLAVKKIYTKGRRIKLEIALVKGKTLFDKRETIKKREVKKRIGQFLKRTLRER